MYTLLFTFGVTISSSSGSHGACLLSNAKAVLRPNDQHTQPLDSSTSALAVLSSPRSLALPNGRFVSSSRPLRSHRRGEGPGDGGVFGRSGALDRPQI